MGILWILAQIVSPIFCLVYALALFTWRFTRRTTFTIAGIFLIIITVANFFCVMNLYPKVHLYPILDFVYRIANLLVMGLFAIFLISYRAVQVPRVLFVMLSVYLCVYFTDTIAIAIRTIFGTHALEMLFEMMLYPFMLLVMIRLRKPFLEVANYMGNRIWKLCFVPASLLVTLFMQISIPVPLEQRPSNIPVALMLCVVTASAYSIIFFLFRTVQIQNNLEQNAIAFRISVSALEHQDELVSRKADEAALLRHDMRHITQMMSVCVENGDIEGMRDLLVTLDKNMSAGFGVKAFQTVTGHRLIDSTLSYYVDAAKASGIDITISMEPMNNVRADKTELAVVLANALENAVYACQKLPDGQNRIIQVDGHRRGKQFFLEVANTCADGIIFNSDTGLPVSNAPEHGLGSQSIAFFAEKYGAEIEYRQENAWFHLRLLL